MTRCPFPHHNPVDSFVCNSCTRKQMARWRSYLGFWGRPLVDRGWGIRLNIILSTVCYQPCSVSLSNKEKNRNDSICIIPSPQSAYSTTLVMYRPRKPLPASGSSWMYPTQNFICCMPPYKDNQIILSVLTFSPSLFELSDTNEKSTEKQNSMGYVCSTRLFIQGIDLQAIATMADMGLVCRNIYRVGSLADNGPLLIPGWWHRVCFVAEYPSVSLLSEHTDLWGSKSSKGGILSIAHI